MGLVPLFAFMEVTGVLPDGQTAMLDYSVIYGVDKYTCACGEGCNCDTISQKPGNCSCGKDMKKVE